MNAAVVLIVLLLAVPLQLFLSHYLQQVYLESSLLNHDAIEKAASRVDRDGQILVTDQDSRKNVKEDLETMRADSMERLVEITWVDGSIRTVIFGYSTCMYVCMCLCMKTMKAIWHQYYAGKIRQ